MVKRTGRGHPSLGEICILTYTYCGRVYVCTYTCTYVCNKRFGQKEAQPVDLYATCRDAAVYVSVIVSRCRLVIDAGHPRRLIVW